MSASEAAARMTVVTQKTGRKSHPLNARWKSDTPTIEQIEPTTLPLRWAKVMECSMHRGPQRAQGSCTARSPAAPQPCGPTALRCAVRKP